MAAFADYPPAGVTMQAVCARGRVSCSHTHPCRPGALWVRQERKLRSFARWSIGGHRDGGRPQATNLIHRPGKLAGSGGPATAVIETIMARRGTGQAARERIHRVA